MNLISCRRVQQAAEEHRYELTANQTGDGDEQQTAAEAHRSAAQIPEPKARSWWWQCILAYVHKQLCANFAHFHPFEVLLARHVTTPGLATSAAREMLR